MQQSFDVNDFRLCRSDLYDSLPDEVKGFLEFVRSEPSMIKLSSSPSGNKKRNRGSFDAWAAWAANDSNSRSKITVHLQYSSVQKRRMNASLRTRQQMPLLVASKTPQSLIGLR